MPRPYIVVNSTINLCLPDPQWAEQIFNIIDQQRNYLGTWLPWIKATRTAKDTLRFLREANLYNKGGQRFTSFITYDEQVIGSIGFVKIDKTHRIGEIGYWLHQDFQGKGITTKCCKKIISHGFTKLRLNRIEIRILVGNDRSMRIPERLQFKHEGTLRQSIFMNNQFYDVELFSLLMKDWCA